MFISLRCTQSCAHCLYACSPNHGEHMSWEVFARALSIAEQNKIPALNFFGGEPLINPQFFLMLQTALDKGFSLLLATNCKPLATSDIMTSFLDISQKYKKNIIVYTARDEFHLKFYDPTEVVNQLQSLGYEVLTQNYSNQVIALSEYNTHNRDLKRLNTGFSCCAANWKDNVGVLPGGGWTICPPSLEPFGNIFSDSLENIVNFKRGLPLRFEKGCTKCMKDFKDFRKIFEIKRSKFEN